MSNDPDYWTPQEKAESIRGAVMDEPVAGETVGELRERMAFGEGYYYTFTITTAHGQVFEVAIQERT